MDQPSYQAMLERWKRSPIGRLRCVGTSSGYPLMMWEHRGGPIRVYLSAGIHGDEPAGPAAVTRLIEKPPAWFRRFSWTVFPCLRAYP